MKSKYRLPSKNSMKKRAYTLFFKTFYTYDEKGNLKEDFNILLKAKEDSLELLSSINNYPELKKLLDKSVSLD